MVAVNVAVVPEFGGSNLGVPADRARLLLERVAAAEASQDSARAAQDTTVAAPDPRG